MTAHCHRQIREVAIEAATELYETLMDNNELRAAWKQQNPGCGEKALLDKFVAKHWSRCIPFARATLATMLHPSRIAALDPATADNIIEVLRLDATLRRGRGRQGQVLGLKDLG
jgi:hypothetical protein